MASQQEPLTSTGMSAEQFIKRLEALGSPEQAREHLRYFKTGPGEYGEGDQFIGVRMGQVFALAKEFIDMRPERDRNTARKPDPRSTRGRGEHYGQAGTSQENTAGAAEKSCSTCICGATIESTTGIWSTAAHHTWSAATCSTSRAISCIQLARSDNHMGAPHRDRQHRLLHSAGRSGRYLQHRRAVACRRSGPDSQGDRLDAARGRRRGSAAAARLFGSTRRHDAAHRAALRDRALRSGTA